MSNKNSILPIVEQPKNHAVIVLAGGLSQRLGQSKQLLMKNNTPLMSHMIKLALATQPQTIIVITPDNVAINAATDELVAQNSTVTRIINTTPETGMAHSLSLAITALEAFDNTIDRLKNLSLNRVLIMGIDQVLLDAQHLSQLLVDKNTIVASSYSDLDSNFEIVQSQANIIGLPITLDYHLLKKWQPMLNGDKGLRSLIRALPTKQLSTIINAQLSYDIDTPEQFCYAKQQGWLDN